MATLVDRFLDNSIAEPNTGCWLWLGYVDKDGYGEAWIDAERHRKFRAHRLSHELFIGEIPAGHDVHHKCRSRSCINPQHLEALDRRTHIMEFTDGNPAFKNSRKTHCIRGHEFNEADTIRSADGLHRRCRICTAMLSGKSKAATLAKGIPLLERGYQPDPTITHCPKGHEYTPDNSRFDSFGRSCKECHRNRENERHKQAPCYGKKKGVPVGYKQNRVATPITHCKYGHLLGGDNLKIKVDKRGYGHRECVTCYLRRKEDTKAKAQTVRDAAKARI